MVKTAESPYMGRVLLLLASFRKPLLRGPWPEVPEELGRATATRCGLVPRDFAPRGREGRLSGSLSVPSWSQPVKG